MTDQRETEIEERLALLRHTEASVLTAELLKLRRERHRDKLEGSEDPTMRGRAKECKDLLHIFLTTDV